MNTPLLSSGRHDLGHFHLSDMIQCGNRLREIGETAASMEEAAGRIVRFFYESFLERSTGDRCCALVRCFKTHELGRLPADLAAIARAALPDPAAEYPGMPCHALLATAGEQPEWNDRQRSTRHQAIPLVSVESIERTPMLAQLILQMGLDLSSLLRPNPAFILDAEGRVFNVFFVPQAEGSPFVPDQDFVKEHGIRSVIGFGGLLASGDFFAFLLFCRVPVEREVADMFRTIALSTRLVLLPFSRGIIFEGEAAPMTVSASAREYERSRAEAATLRLIIPALEQVALRQNHQLQAAVQHLGLTASTDALTGIANRRTFDEVLPREYKRALREVVPLAFLMLDIDFFKQLNDMLGHQAGDACLRIIAHTLNTLARRPGDLVARIGGEEFAILLPNTSREGALKHAENIRTTIHALALDHPGSPWKQVTISIGCAVLDPADEPSSGTALSAKADRALYEAKNAGRNRIAFA
jgi:diguanylate cyclase (GGDEF)-like protein